MREGYIFVHDWCDVWLGSTILHYSRSFRSFIVVIVGIVGFIISLIALVVYEKRRKASEFGDEMRNLSVSPDKLSVKVCFVKTTVRSNSVSVEY